MDYELKKRTRIGSIPKPGQLFRIPGGRAVYICVNDETAQTGTTTGISLESVNPHSLQNNTSRRQGFIILEQEAPVVLRPVARRGEE